MAGGIRSRNEKLQTPVRSRQQSPRRNHRPPPPQTHALAQGQGAAKVGWVYSPTVFSKGGRVHPPYNSHSMSGDAPRPTYPPELPVSQKRGEIAAAIQANQVIVLCGE